ncbi:MAG: hypothetical protein FWC71_08795 [Defluviitaleaceae bacterium]|nr:hypothetical protein [Defluviitaleaceae bacterium]
MKKKSNLGKMFKQIFFTYLLVNKVMYWMDIISSVDNWSEFGNVFVNRMLGQDIMVIMVLIAMFILEKYLYPETGEEHEFLYNLKLLSIGLVIFILLIVGYNRLMFFILDESMPIERWPAFIGELVMGYIIIAFVIYVKELMKKKEVETYLPCTNDPTTQLSMLTSLYEAGVLTDEELAAKTEQIKQ